MAKGPLAFFSWVRMSGIIKSKTKQHDWSEVVKPVGRKEMKGQMKYLNHNQQTKQSDCSSSDNARGSIKLQLLMHRFYMSKCLWKNWV